MDVNTLSPEQLEQLKSQIAAKEEADKKQKQEELDTYKQLVDDAVAESLSILRRTSSELSQTKSGIYELFHTILEMKADLFKNKKGKKDQQWSHTFTNRDGNMRITLGVRTLDNYDDTAEDGIAMVNAYLDDLAENNPKAEEAVAICRSLMSRDKKGNLKPGKIVTLYAHAKKSGNKQFMEGVELIMSAYHPIASKQFITAEYKDEGKNEWVNVPLGMTEAE